MISISRNYRDTLNIFILFIFAVSQPIASLLGNNPLFFVARHSDLTEMIIFTLVLFLVLPCLAASLHLVALKVHRLVGSATGTVLVALCAGLFFAPMLADIEWIDGRQIIFLNVTMAVSFTALYYFLPGARTYTLYLLPAIFVFPIVFLFNADLDDTAGTSDLSANQIEIANANDVVILVFDSMPILSLLESGGEIDSTRYPNIWRLSQEASWYRNASTVNDTTSWAVPSLLTGRVLHGEIPLPTYKYSPDNLFTAIGGQYEVHAWEYITKLCPPSICKRETLSRSDRMGKFRELFSDVVILYRYSVTPVELTDNLPRIHETFGGFATGNLAKEGASAKKKKRAPKSLAEEFFAAIQKNSKPQLLFLHILLPHAPWRYLPSGKEYGNGFYAQIHGLNGLTKEWGADSWAVAVAYQRHLLQTAYVDIVVGQVVQRLKDADLYHQSMLIVLSDHGSSYKLKDNHRHLTEGNKADIVGIPLFIKYPYQTEGGADDRDASIVDVLPTIFEQLGIKTGWQLDGISLLDKEVRARSEKIIYSGKGERFKVDKNDHDFSNTVADKFKLLATGENIDSLFNISLYPALNGVQISDITLVDSDDSFLMHNPQEFEQVDLSSDYLPAFLSGTAPSLKPDTALAIALNGKIITVTKVFTIQVRHRYFAAMLPESAFRQGKNTISIHRVAVVDGKFSLFTSSIKAIER